ncbi:MAG: hypothetical protein CVT95_04240 [Bacteroidetes bacterium HGW-Bacteroidetes-12]|nr:MAG: hypothetical protein CVT95_04240 [Bacteroidetes bacterium HGW-Bacteroidetes-12]
MKPSKELFHLIKSLTKSEKRYFKLMSSLQTGEKNYIKLFEFVEEQDSYDEEALKNQFKDENFIKHLPSEKNHLYKLILKSLRGFHADTSAASIIQENLRNIELLFNKALYTECYKNILRTKETAYIYEKYYFLLDLIDWEKKLVEEAFLDNKFKVNMDNLIEEESDCIEKLRNIAEYQKLYSRLNYVIRKGGYTRNKEGQNEIEKIASHPLIIGTSTAHSIKATTACYSIKGLCAVTNHDHKTASENFNKVIKIMEANPPIMKELPKRYIRALNNVLYTHLVEKDWDKTLSIIEKMKALETKSGFESIDIQLKLFTLPFNAELNTYISKGEYAEAIKKVVPEILERLQHFNGKVNKEEEMLFYYNISRAYFFTEDLKGALRYINLVLNENKPGLRDDVYTFARLVNLIIHYELNNLDLLEYNIKSTKRFLSINKRDYKFEAIFIQEMRKLTKCKTEEKLKEQFIEFKKSLLTILQDPYEKIALDYFDFLIWLDSKINNQSFVKLMLLKAKNGR